MTYTNPLGIFSEDQLTKLTEKNLKSLKKEILLHFQLSEEATIERNGKQYDKNQVLEIFDDLQKNLDVHSEIFSNKPLLAFLQNGDLGFFNNKVAVDSVQRAYLFRDRIDKYVAAQINQVSSALLSKVTPKSPKALASILEYSSKMSGNVKDKAYNKAYLELKTHVDGLRQKYPNPFANTTGLAIHPDLDELIDPVFYDCFQYLPGAFQDIGFTYGVWCHNEIVNQAFRRESVYYLYNRNDLATISRAMEIGCHVTKSEAFRENTREVKNYLDSGGEASPRRERPRQQPQQQSQQQTQSSRHNQSQSKTNSSQQAPRYRQGRSAAPRSTGGAAGAGKTILTIVLLIVGVFRLLIGFSQCNRSDSYSRNSRVDYSKVYEREAERLKRRQAGITRTAKKIKLSKFIGNNASNWNAKVLRTEVVNNVIELDVEVDVFPTHYKEFSLLIPKDIKEKYFGETKDFVIKFINKEFKNHTFSYRFRTVINEMEGRNNVILDQKRNDKGGKLSFTVKRLLKKKRIKGSITRYATMSNGAAALELSSTPFEIADDIKITAKVEKDSSGKLPTFAEEKFDRWDDYAISNVKDQQYKNIILNNFNQVAHKVLKQGNYYKIQTMATYVPKGQDHKEPIAENLFETKGNVTLDYVSSEDDVATVTLYHDNYNIRYFVSGETQRIIGMNMATESSDGLVVELIEAYFE